MGKGELLRGGGGAGAGPVARTDQFNYHPDPQPGLQLALPSIHPIWDLQELVKGSVLWNNNHRNSMTWGGCGTSERSFDEEP